ncbi:MAG: integral rane sensor signal transduction histidine kinase [Firmicutes bacterium]|nr:integral rane sensor signal transduction histidine kinase [Bacillota bacterium]
MFSRIRNRLTMLYAVIMAMFLLAFISACYTGVIWVLYREEQQDLRSLTVEEAREQAAIFKQREAFLTPKLKEDDNIYNTGTKIFYYVFDAFGQQTATDEPAREMRTSVLDIIRRWDAQDGEVRLKKFYLPNGERGIVLMCSMKIYDGPRVLGTIFMGEDITSYYQVLKMLLMVMVIIAILFLVIAIFVGHYLAGRAIIPIQQSFLRQREFVADASHELRTPLSVFLISIDAIQSDDDNHLSMFSIQVLDDMKNEIRRMSKIVADLLTLARADAGVTSIMKEKFHFHIVAEQVIRSLQPLAAEKNIKLEMTENGDIPVWADKERMNQLLVILIDNAIKYTPNGGRVDVLIKKITGSSPYIHVIVQDTGIGISEADQNLIFERFYRVDKARSREEGGTGLGLSIVKWIVEAHNGTIKIESRPGEGSSFIMILPIFVDRGL